VQKLNRAVILAGMLCIAADAQSSKMIRVDDNFNGREVTLQTGEALEIALAENATTGFQWLLKTKPDFVEEFQDTEPSPSPGPPGRGGIHRFYFRAVQPGTGELDLAYRRSWEKEKPPARSFRLRIRVVR